MAKHRMSLARYELERAGFCVARRAQVIQCPDYKKEKSSILLKKGIVRKQAAFPALVHMISEARTTRAIEAAV